MANAVDGWAQFHRSTAVSAPQQAGWGQFKRTAPKAAAGGAGWAQFKGNTQGHAPAEKPNSGLGWTNQYDDPTAERHGGHGVFELLGRGDEALQALMAGHNPIQPLMRGESEQTFQQNQRAGMRSLKPPPGAIADPTFEMLSQDPNLYNLTASPFNLMLPEGTAARAGRLLSPATHAVGEVLGRAGAAVGRGVSAAGNVADKVGAKIGVDLPHAREQFGDWVGLGKEAGQHLLDQFHWGGQNARLAGKEFATQARRHLNTYDAERHEIARRANTDFDALIKGMSPDDERTMYRALNGEIPMSIPHEAPGRLPAGEAHNQVPVGASIPNPDIPAPLRSKILQARTLLDTLQHINAKPDIAHDLSQIRNIPDRYAEFAAPPGEAVFARGQRRTSYLPAPNTAEARAARGETRPEPYNVLYPKPTAVQQRERFFVRDTPNELIRSAIKARINGAARDAAAARLRGRVAEEERMLRPPVPPNSANLAEQPAADIAQGIAPGRAGAPTNPDAAARIQGAKRALYDRTSRATGAKRTGGEKFQDFVNAPGRLYRDAMIAGGLKHPLVNVSTLMAGLRGPAAAASALAEAVKVSRMSPEERYEYLKPAIQGGVISAPRAEGNVVSAAIKKLPLAVRAAGGALMGGAAANSSVNEVNPKAPLYARAGADTLGAIGGGVLGANAPKLNEAASNYTWSMDDVAKMRAYQAELEKNLGKTSAFENPNLEAQRNVTAQNQAARDTLKHLIDYNNSDAVTNALKSVLQFATYKKGILGSVGSAIAKHPGRMYLADKATGGALSSGNIPLPIKDQSTGKNKTLHLSTPISEFNDATDIAPGGRVFNYVRNAMTPTSRMGMNALVTAATRGKNRKDPDWWTYGGIAPYRDRDNKLKAGAALEALTELLPLQSANTVLDQSGFEGNEPDDILNMLLGPTVGGYVR